MEGSSGVGGEEYYRNKVEELSKEREGLYSRVDGLEKENRELRKSLYELSVRVGEKGRAAKKGVVGNGREGGRGAGDASSEPGSETGEMEVAVKLRFKCDMAGHAGAVYAVCFSGNGQLLASGSMDKSVAIWDVNKVGDSALLTIPQAHAANVVALAWSMDSRALLSGGYDHHVREWDVMATRKAPPVAEHAAKGFVQTVIASPVSDHLAYFGTSKNAIHRIDRRTRPSGNPDESVIITNEAMVNTLFMELSGNLLFSGDHGGALRIWDMRMVSSDNENEPYGLLDEKLNSPDRYPITHIHGAPQGSDEEDRFLAVNSYDKYLRVYDRGAHILEAQSQKLELLHSLSGHQNRNWPIRSSFYRGEQYVPSFDQRRTQLASADTFVDDLEHARQLTKGIHRSLLVATGSADGNAYVFDVSGPAGSGALLQVLTGHTDRVYCVDFHPEEPILATASADSKIKIWTPAKYTSTG